MKKVLTLVVIVVFGLVTPVMALDLENGPPSTWSKNSISVLETEDTMLDTFSYSISMVAKDGDITINFLSKYHEGKNVYFNSTRRIKASVYKSEVDVKFDDKRGYTIPIQVSRDRYTAVFIHEDDEADFIKKCLKHKKLQVRLTEYDGWFVGKITHNFSLLHHFPKCYKQITTLQKKAR